MKDWDMMFTWREGGMTTDRLQLLLREAGLPFDFSEESFKKINSWIANPMLAIEREREILETILPTSAIYCYLEDPDAESNSKLFAALFNKLGLREEEIDVTWFSMHDSRLDSEAKYEKFRQTESSEWQQFYCDGDFDVVKFIFREVEYVFYAEACPPRLDINSVMCNFDAFMEHLGREERVFRIQMMERWDDGATFIVGTPDKLEKLMGALGFSGIRTSLEIKATLHVR